MLGTWHDDILALHNKYGRVVRIAPDEVAVVDADAMKKLYGHGGQAVKTSWYSTWGKNISSPSLFPEQDKRIHAFLRRRISAPYSMTGVLKYEPYIQACLDLLWARLGKHVDAGEIVDMSNWTNALAFDVIGELGYGEQLGQLRTETDYMDLRKTIYQGFFFMASLGHVPGQSALITNSFVKAIMGMLGLPEPMGSFLSWSTARVHQRLDEIKDGKTQEREDMLAHFCRMKSMDGSPAQHEEILVEVLSLM
jgi:cytochrome P450